MVRVERPAIDPNGRIVAPLFDRLFTAGMASGAERLQCTENEFVRIAVMRLNVIGARGRNYPTRGHAHLAQRFEPQLQPGSTTPVLSSVKAAQGSS